MATTAAAPRAPYRQFLIVNNVQKAKNIKNMLVSASSFGVTEVFVVGQKKFELHDHAAFLASLQCPVTRMQSLAECRAHCVAHGIRIVGVEIMESAKSLLDEPFQGDTAFIMGNEVRTRACVVYVSIVNDGAAHAHETQLNGCDACMFVMQGSGMNAAQVAICDAFVIIPQYGGGTASLNVTVAASIIMNSFAVWAQIPEAPSLPATSVSPAAAAAVAVPAHE